MITETDFLRQIADNPNDDTTRLVYADWLEERGDARAEFLRLEVALAQLEFGTPQHEQLFRRLYEVCKTIDLAWALPLERNAHVMSITDVCNSEKGNIVSGKILCESVVVGDRVVLIGSSISREGPIRGIAEFVRRWDGEALRGDEAAMFLSCFARDEIEVGQQVYRTMPQSYLPKPATPTRANPQRRTSVRRYRLSDLWRGFTSIFQ
jgi:uncharacterized protein (TIGR02996 family)